MNGFHDPYRPVSVKVAQTIATGAGITMLRSMLVMTELLRRRSWWDWLMVVCRTTSAATAAEVVSRANAVTPT
jgi:hypothetical protein